MTDIREYSKRATEAVCTLFDSGSLAVRFPPGTVLRSLVTGRTLSITKVTLDGRCETLPTLQGTAFMLRNEWVIDMELAENLEALRGAVSCIWRWRPTTANMLKLAEHLGPRYLRYIETAEEDASMRLAVVNGLELAARLLPSAR